MATPDDWEEIALLHARSWQENYRGALSDDYLDNQVIDERKKVWKERFSKVDTNQITILAKDENKLVGLSCIFLNHDEQYGALLDNLHVHKDYKRLGIGKVLMDKSISAVNDKTSGSDLYLLVLTQNHGAVRFYESVGGKRMETKTWETSDGSTNETYLYLWKAPN